MPLDEPEIPLLRFKTAMIIDRMKIRATMVVSGGAGLRPQISGEFLGLRWTQSESETVRTAELVRVKSNNVCIIELGRFDG